MSELLIRASSLDEALLRKAFGSDPRHRRWPVRPDRVVVDAHVPIRSSAICETARSAGIGYLIDPQTYFFQDDQPTADRWVQLPFGVARALTPDEAIRPSFLTDLTHRVFDYQMRHNATSLIPPYVHMDGPTSEWIDVQAAMWHYARAYLDKMSVGLPVTAVMAVGWRLLHRTDVVDGLAPAMRALVDLAPREIALAASKVDQGAKPAKRAIDLVAMVERLSHDYDVLLWQQGKLGELGVAAGARGYETGIGWRERCDLTASMQSRRVTANSGSFSPRPVYVTSLGQSIPRRLLTELRQHRDVWTRLICTDQTCCPAGGSAFIENSAAHTIIQRARRVRELSAIDRDVWRWQNLAESAENGLEIASRIARLKANGALTSRVSTASLEAIRAVSDQRRQDRRASSIA
jgi:hypothetical protein